MPLTGYQLFADDVTVETAEDGQIIIDFQSGGRGVTLRLSRAMGTKLQGTLGIALKDRPEAEVVELRKH